ncbi:MULTISPECIES: Gfo/Idh/MocA family protein [Metabacillus]|uniref:Dehydrogenase n=2 Tax=Metabacillus TaxID=2675233 RepID=A0A179T7U3_9BACI|nr:MULTISPECIES: Gfo/Idh/MocA family oxidoreductase [Metabacillus]OAS88463.1 dehydrogenase [Metabacillus litoralis]QNF30347.1 Gfo/Idh/MocA family oxidoreductase [Metabacillus sp. KUDC1714]
MINVALLSKWHVHAVDYALQAEQNKNITIKAVWDENPERGKKWAQELGVRFEFDLLNVLKDAEIDAVIVDSPTNLHKEIISLAANHKKHVFTEKVLAFTNQDCEEIFSIIKENQVKLMVSLPRLTESYYLYAQDVLEKGLIGKLTSIRCRCAHNGAVSFEGNPNGWLPSHFFNKEECGGGALIDLGAHPIYLTNRLAGPVKAVTARLQQTLGYDVDDNAVVLVEYESGALGTIETSFLSNGSPFQLELYGTEGTLMIEDGKARLKSNLLDGEWSIPNQLPKSHPMPLEQWVAAIIDNSEPTINENDIRNLTLINQAASLSNEIGQRVEISDISKLITN